VRPSASSLASAPSSTNTPATGEASIVARPSAPLRARRCARAADHAATPAAIPSRNGIRPIATLESTPAVNSHDAIAPWVTDGADARASGVNSATAAIAASTPTFAGPIAAASGENSSE
jgi:hypothetical protein